MSVNPHTTDAERSGRLESRQRGRLAHLTVLARALGTAHTQDDIFHAFRDFAPATLPCSGFFISRYHPEHRERTCVYAWSEGEEVDVSVLPPMPLNASPNSRAIITGEPVIVDDYQVAVAGLQVVSVGIDRDPRLPQSSVTVPMASMGRTLGAIQVQSTTPAAYTGEDAGLLTTAAAMVAVAMENVELLTREREARAAAEASVRLRDEFLSIAAHELKTPITSLSAMAELAQRRMARERQVDRAWLERALSIIHEQARKQARLVEHLLDTMYLQEGHLALARAPADVAALVRSVVAGMQPITDRHSISVHAPDTLMADVDVLRLEQVLLNLLDNAIKYSPQGGPVTVELTAPTPATLRLAVSDSGIGVPEEQRPHLFSRFFQAHRADHRSGMGLGLFLAKEWVRLHGGDIAAEFPAEGGSRFVITLPATSAPATSRGANR